MSVIRRDQLVVTPWKNRRGRKADVAEGEGWFVGLAWIEARAAFSDFPGMDRTITLVEGEGFTLTVDGEPHVLRGAGALHSFPGELPVVAEPLAGPCTVLNAMTRRGSWSHQVRVAGELPPDGFALVLHGTVDDPSGPARAGDILALPHTGAPSPDLQGIVITLAPGWAAPGWAPWGSNPQPTDSRS